MSDHGSSPLRRYRRRILGWGVLGVVVLCGIAAPLFLRSVERDLEDRVPTELAERGFEGVSAAFSGQDGVLRCVAPLAEPEDAITAAIDVWGVRAIELDRSCRVGGSASDATDAGSTTPDATVTGSSLSTSPTSSTTSITGADGPPDFESIIDIVASGRQFTILASLIDDSEVADTFAGNGPVTLFAPTDDAFDELPADLLAAIREDPDQLDELLLHHGVTGSLASDTLESGDVEMLDGSMLTVSVGGDEITIGSASVTDTDLLAPNGVVHVIDTVLLPPSIPVERTPIVSGTLTAGRVELDGTVADETQRATLVDTVSLLVDPINVDDQLVIDSDAAIDDQTVLALAELVAAMTPNLVRGDSGFDGSELYTDGVFVDDEGRRAFLAVADLVSAAATLAPRPTASVADAGALEDELNAFVGANPISFAPASAAVAPDALVVLDQLAGIAKQFDGVTITVEGHTDSDGVPAENQTLSEERAEVVLAGLVDRGVPAADLEADGLGSTRPVEVGGVEDKAASRRIEFRVTTAAGA